MLFALREQHPSVDRFLITIMAGYVRRLSAMVLDAMYLPVEQRVRRQLVELARIYGGEAHRAEIHLTQDDIANLASTSPTHRSAHDNRPTNPAADDACVEETDTEQTDAEQTWAEQRPHHYGDLLRYASYLLADDTPKSSPTTNPSPAGYAPSPATSSSTAPDADAPAPPKSPSAPASTARAPATSTTSTPPPQ